MKASNAVRVSLTRDAGSLKRIPFIEGLVEMSKKSVPFVDDGLYR